MRRGLFLAILAIMAGLGAWRWQTRPATPELSSAASLSTSAATARPPVPVHIARAETSNMPILVTAIGHVAPFNTVQLKSRVDGQIDAVDYREGQDVHVGDPLIEIDPRPYRSSVQQAEGQLARDQAQLTAARADLDRANALVAKGFTSRQAFDQQTASVAQSAGALSADQASLDNARLNLSFTTIRAPISGRIGRRLVDAGNIIHSGDGAVLAEIVQIHPIAVMLTVPQADLAAIRISEKQGPVPIHALSVEDSKRLSDGVLAVIGNQIDQATGTIEIKASFANEDSALWPGQFVTAEVETGHLDKILSVPVAAVQPGPNGKFAYVVDPDGTVRAASIKVLGAVAGAAAIQQGLVEGDRVVIDNQDQLAPGAPVRIVSAAETAAAPRAS